jgi:chromosome partitioning protein
MTIFAILNQKGGVGKTCVAINFAAALAERDQEASVLLVDLDPQGHCTEGCGMKEIYTEEISNLYDALVVSSKAGRGKSTTSENIDVEGIIKAVPNERFFLIPSHYKMMLAEQALNPVKGREYRLEMLLAATGDAFTDIVIDCPPNLGILTDNAINASRNLVIPVQAEQTSMRALDLLLDQVETIESGLRIQVKILAIVPNLVQPSKLSRRILADLRQNIETTIPFDFPKRVVLQEAYENGKSIFTYIPEERSKGPDVEELRTLYLKLAEIVKERSATNGEQ